MRACVCMACFTCAADILYLLADMLYLLAGMLYLCCYRKRESVCCVVSLRFGLLRSEPKLASAVAKPALTNCVVSLRFGRLRSELKHAPAVAKPALTDCVVSLRFGRLRSELKHYLHRMKSTN